MACDDSGSIKELICNKNTDTSVQKALQPFHVEAHLSEGLNSRVQLMKLTADGLLLAARANGSIQLIQVTRDSRDMEGKDPATESQFEVSHLQVVSSVLNLFDESRLVALHKQSKKRSKPRDGFVALDLIPGTANRVMCATRSGRVHVLALKDNTLELLTSNSVKAPLEFAQVYDFSENKPGNKKRKSKSATFAYGGEENLVKICQFSSDYKKIEQVWEAKNVSNDRLDLKVPIWPMKLRFLEPATGVEEGKVNYQFVTINHLGHFRQYKTSVGRKPIKSYPLLAKNESATQLCALNCELTASGNIKSDTFENLELVTTDSKKNVFSFNARSEMLGKYGNGDITGYASFIDVCDQKYLLQGGLDRYVRVFDPKTRAQICKCYTNSKVSSILLIDDDEVQIPQPENSKKRKSKEEYAEEAAQEDEQIWSVLEGSKKRAKNL